MYKLWQVKRYPDDTGYLFVNAHDASRVVGDLTLVWPIKDVTLDEVTVFESIQEFRDAS